ncbi:hypothetical protein M8037_10135 [Sinorhizobium meliloti]|uniref:phage regulatory CII family protein n=1 Tax=Rhizobium meliloti TaxID=382 RepID=UPI002072A503|nr:phage regulatory CII family protein [Sinorhizobium meliloti]MCM5689156.1 hypothetical protein [Sinorhizobium meliloti]
MTNETLTNAWFHRLKAATRMLIKLNGGIEACAELTSLSKSQIGRCNSDKDPDLLPIPSVIRLEAECGNPVVTRAMAELHGCQLVNPDEQGHDDRCLMRDNAEMQQRNSEFQSGLYSAAGDNVITPNEAMRSLRDLQSLKQKISDVETGLTDVIAKGGQRGDLKLVYGGEQ